MPPSGAGLTTSSPTSPTVTRDRGDRRGSLAPKQELFAELERICGRRGARDEHVGPASRDRVGSFDASTRRRMHFFNRRRSSARGDHPRGARVGRAVETASRSARSSASIRSAATNTGFVVNRVLIPLLNDCIRSRRGACQRGGSRCRMKHGSVALARASSLTSSHRRALTRRGALREDARASDGPPPRLVACGRRLLG